MTKGDQAFNVRRGMDLAVRLLDAGHSPYLPHLSWFLDLTHPRTWARWIEHDLVWMRACACVIRIPGLSDGADKEVEEALVVGIPVMTEEEFFEEERHHVET